MYSQQSNSRRDNGFQTAPMLGQQSGTSQPQLLNNNLPSGCFLEILTAVLLFNVVGEISSYFVMTCPPVYPRAIKAFTADWTVASKAYARTTSSRTIPVYCWHTPQLART